MKGLPVGTCRSCGAEVSYFALSCPRCGAANLPNPVAAVAALLAVMLIGGMTVLGVLALRATPPETPSTSSPAGGSAGKEGAPDDYGWIVKAMAECEEEAKIRTETLHFLIVPVSSTTTPIMGWAPSPIGPVGRRAVLLTSSDVFIGLRNNAMALYRQPLAFAVSDPATQVVYKWSPAVGVTLLKTRETGATSLTLGFEFSGDSNELEWGPTINLSPGTCYWINLLVRSRPRAKAP
jgi:hypothetical protein